MASSWIEAGAREPDPVARLEEEHLWAECARIRAAPGFLEERVDKARLNLDVVVQKEHVFCAALARISSSSFN